MATSNFITTIANATSTFANANDLQKVLTSKLSPIKEQNWDMALSISILGNEDYKTYSINFIIHEEVSTKRINKLISSLTSPQEGLIAFYARKDHSDPKLTSESNWRWETNCKELVLKLQSNNIRTKAFTQQLIVLAKQFGTLTHKNYTNHAKGYIKQGF